MGITVFELLLLHAETAVPIVQVKVGVLLGKSREKCVLFFVEHLNKLVGPCFHVLIYTQTP
jgi:hypothetical protein